MKEMQERALDLLQSSSCYRGDVCVSLPCACAETIAKLVEVEREQCALIVLNFPFDGGGTYHHLQKVAAAIRTARSQPRMEGKPR